MWIKFNYPHYVSNKINELKKTCLVNKVNSWSQENNQLFKPIRLYSLSDVFDEHDSYHSLASSSLQHSYCVPPLCNFKHLQLITKTTKQNRKINNKINPKELKIQGKKEKYILGMKLIELVEGEGPSTAWSWPLEPISGGFGECTSPKLRFSEFNGECILKYLYNNSVVAKILGKKKKKTGKIK